MFASWMRILDEVDGSVLWLLADNEAAARHLRVEASARNIDPDRLVFAPRMELPDHLARQRLADLFLDTQPCTAHTTASDALWAGLPLLTQIGDTFAGRVAASLLNAIGLPGLITATREQYEALAIDLAADPAKLVAIRHKLDDNRLTTPLFDTERLARNIERAFTAIHERHEAGLPPDHLHIGR
jgi:predicted O-linked N-acetylglucosamine transferase (SPINDLY family)